MAEVYQTTYDLFMHYYNDHIGQCVTNRTTCEWYQAETKISEYNPMYQPMTEKDIEYPDRATDKQKEVIRRSNRIGSDYLTYNQMDQYKLQHDQETLEIIYISPDSETEPNQYNEKVDLNLNTSKYEELVVNSSHITNPKYDMIFTWDGLGYFNGPKETNPDHQIIVGVQKNNDQEGDTVLVKDNVQDLLYYDKMKRIKFRPWFFHSKYHSLKAIMDKANELVDIFGKDNILIGKEVPLEQYIEVV